MATYIVASGHRYQVEADTPELAIASYRVHFDGIEPEAFGLTMDSVIDQDDFEYLDGQAEVGEAE
jgi:hypothetical protein